MMGYQRKQFSALKIAMAILKCFAFIIFAFGCYFIYTSLREFVASGVWTYFLIHQVAVLVHFVSAVAIYSLSELILLLILIEQNTYRTFKRLGKTEPKRPTRRDSPPVEEWGESDSTEPFNRATMSVGFDLSDDEEADDLEVLDDEADV